MKVATGSRGRPKRPRQPAGGTKKTSLTDAATQFLRDHIIDLTLPPGERVDEKSMLERFALSRTPVREALNRLSAEGLVEFRSNHGAYVAPMSLRHTMDLLTAYVLSENMIAAVCNLEDPSLADDLRGIQDRYERVAGKKNLLAITEVNSRFHGRIASASDNQFISQYSADLHNLARRISFFVYQRERRVPKNFDYQLSRIVSQHHSIIDAIDRGHRADLIRAVTDHAGVFRQRLCAIIGDNIEGGLDFAAVLDQHLADSQA